MGNTYNGTLVNSLATLATAINADDSSIITCAWNAGSSNQSGVLQLNQTPWNLTFVSDTLRDTAVQVATGTLSGIGSSDVLSGTLSGQVLSIPLSLPVDSADGDTSGATLADAITAGCYGLVTASYDSATGTINLVSQVGISVSGLTVDSSQLINTSTGGSGTPATPAAPATISYSASGGQSLSGTSLTNSANARSALTAINAAISDVAAQDGYIGAQINTLNAIGNVLGTQQQNIQAAQNAVQATDYAAATSDMAKYEILMQTGISALAQANSVQQEITKLLQ
jgi:flagellin